MIGSRRVDGFEALTLSSEDGEIEAAFVPEAGMVGCSLQHRGEELLGQRGGLARYVAERSTMGIPLLHPWANRLAERRFGVAGREVDLDEASPPPNPSTRTACRFTVCSRPPRDGRLSATNPAGMAVASWPASTLPPGRT